MNRVTVPGRELSRYHCNACNGNFFTEGEDETYYCPFCGSGTGVYFLTAHWVAGHYTLDNLPDELLLIL